MLVQFIALPEDVKLAISGLVVAFVVFAIEFVIKSVPWLSFLRAYAQEWGLLLAALLIDALQNAMPTGYEDVAIKGVLFILALVGMFIKFAKSKGVKAFS